MAALDSRMLRSGKEKTWAGSRVFASCSLAGAPVPLWTDHRTNCGASDSRGSPMKLWRYAAVCLVSGLSACAEPEVVSSGVAPEPANRRQTFLEGFKRTTAQQLAEQL